MGATEPWLILLVSEVLQSLAFVGYPGSWFTTALGCKLLSPKLHLRTAMFDVVVYKILQPIVFTARWIHIDDHAPHFSKLFADF